MSQEKADYHFVGTREDLQRETFLCKQVQSRRVAVVEAEGCLRAFEDVCPHQGAPLSKGTLKGCVITCPAHNWKFDLTTGESPVVPDEFIYTFEVKEEDGNIFVRI